MAPLSLQSTQKMVSGYEIPIVGFGVYQTPPDITEKVTIKALETGYRHIDSAKYYANEAECANAIRKSGIDRSKVFYTTKVPATHMSYEKAKEAIEASIRDAAGLDYIDLVLLHAPYGGKEGRLGAWRALVEAQKAGKIRSIGVSNYGIHHLEELEAYINSGVGGQISVGQYEIHPWCAREDIAGWLKKRNVVVEAYSPLVQATRMGEPSLQSLAKKHSKTPAQILIRWSLQKGYVPLPKSVTDSRIIENTQVFDFELSPEDMKNLQTNAYEPVCWDPARDSRL
ncbi:aldo/keto reductase family protein [Aspergillus candidus]|uniref:D-xylose reductase [NAD(P)H] n=1 Tax=Aspergillus candidus TaxID=41067 RepID=A0A2I2EY45_ASPCN|nr:aldo-keto reductase [Aspergillus candidus]PLB33303.1 aldo-keto reductase [Aspergillus candidus]